MSLPQTPSYASWPFNYNLDQVFKLFQNSGNPQIGFINISAAASAKPDVEKYVIENVATYGRQLGRISDVLDFALKQLGADKWKDEQADALNDFRTMKVEIDAVKSNRLPPTESNVSDLIAGIKALKDSNREEYERICAELKSQLFPR